MFTLLKLSAADKMVAHLKSESESRVAGYPSKVHLTSAERRNILRKRERRDDMTFPPTILKEPNVTYHREGGTTRAPVTNLPNSRLRILHNSKSRLVNSRFSFPSSQSHTLHPRPHRYPVAAQIPRHYAPLSTVRINKLLPPSCPNQSNISPVLQKAATGFAGPFLMISNATCSGSSSYLKRL